MNQTETIRMPQDRHPEVEIIERRNSPVTNALSIIGAGLTVALLSWISLTVTQNQTQIKLVINNQENIVTNAAVRLLATESDVEDLDRRVARQWARIRTNEANILLISKEVHDLHPNDPTPIELTEPKDY